MFLAILLIGLTLEETLHLYSLALLEEEWLVFVVMGLGVLDEKRLGVFSLFSVMLMGTHGYR